MKKQKTLIPYDFLALQRGEGCFDCSIRKSKSHKTGTQILLRFTLVQHSRDVKLITNFLQYFSCGILGVGANYASFTVTKFSDIRDKIVPFFVKYPLQGSKLNDFKDFCRIVELMDNNHHLTIEGIEEIRAIKDGMNRKRHHGLS